ncbi:EF-hand domain-containing protein [Chitinimonas sp.]|uniref:EF-hand domain-containing protein n=1 Tax=Chitinimonas sp. TaxID=1934313 RepID=UPI002F9212DC
MFKKLDGDGDGSVSEAEFAELAKNAPKLPDGVSAPSFSDFDSDGDGKLTQSEFSEGSKKLEEQLHSQFESMRAQGGQGMQGAQGAPSGPPPGPPPGGEGQGLDKDTISSLAQSTSSANPTASAKLTDLAENFDAADANQDGKVSIEELLAYEEKKQESDTGSTSTTTDSKKTSLQDRLQALVVSLLGDGQDSQGTGVSVTA